MEKLHYTLKSDHVYMQEANNLKQITSDSLWYVCVKGCVNNCDQNRNIPVM